MGEIYFTEKELCEWLKVSRSKVISLRKEGMPFIKLGKSIRFDKEEVEKWLKEKAKTKGTRQPGQLCTGSYKETPGKVL